MALWKNSAGIRYDAETALTYSYPEMKPSRFSRMSDQGFLTILLKNHLPEEGDDKATSAWTIHRRSVMTGKAGELFTLTARSHVDPRWDQRHAEYVETARNAFLSSTGDTAAVVGFQFLQLWDLKTGRPSGNAVDAGEEINNIVFSRDDALFAVVTERSVQRYRTQDLAPVGERIRFTDEGKPIAFTDDVTTMLKEFPSQTREPSLCLVHLEWGKASKPWPKEDFVTHRFTLDGRRLISGGMGANHARDTDLTNPAPREQYLGGFALDEVTKVIDFNGGQVIFGGDGGNIHFEDLRTGDFIVEKSIGPEMYWGSEGTESVEDIVMDDQGTVMAVVYRNVNTGKYTVRLWNLKTTDPFERPIGDPEKGVPGRKIAMSPDGRILAVAHYGRLPDASSEGTVVTVYRKHVKARGAPQA